MSSNNQDRRARRNQLRNNANDEDSKDDEVQEAFEDFNIDADVDENEVEEPEGEDLMENQERDYQPNERLDRYEVDSADEEDVESMDARQRGEVDEMLNERDRIRRRQNRDDQGRNRFHTLINQLDSDEDENNEEFQRRLQQRQQDQMMDDDQEGADEEEEAKFLDHTECKGKLSQWLQEPRTEKWIRRQFRRFLQTHKESGQNTYYYQEKIKEMCFNNLSSFEIKHQHLLHSSHAIKTLSIWINYEPNVIFPILNKVAMGVVLAKYPNYEEIHPEIFVKIADFIATDNIRDLRQKDIGHLIKIEGVITKRTGVFSQLKKVTFVCIRCYEAKGPFFITQGEDIKLGSCAVCQSKGPFNVDKKSTVYRNYQKITLQESPGKVPPGRVPRQKDVVLLGDNIDSARPGDEVSVTGVYTHRYDYNLNVKHGFPLFHTLIEANNIVRVSKVEKWNIPKEDEDMIQKWSKKQNIGEILFNSISPSIHKHNDVKAALCLAMFGGVEKESQNHRTRGDINVLLLGDPGTAKSQFLKSVEKTFHRAVYTTGKGASAVGLTATVRRDPQSREWTLEGGALVLADKGICLIDEFDKMNDHDRTSIHEAMEQQSISISKAGIVANLQARCSVIAAANPIKGRYDSQLSFMDNVDLTNPILSRFDVLCVIKDEVSQDLDNRLATFVINSHMKSHPFNKKMLKENPEQLEKELPLLQKKNQDLPETIPQDLLKKYIMYARQNVKPKITEVDTDQIKNFYSDLRTESQYGGQEITIRHLESIIRLSEANARMHLRNEVKGEDIQLAISIILDSFIKSQKYQVAQSLMKKFRKYLIFKEDSNQLLYRILEQQMKQELTYLRAGFDTDMVQVIKIPHTQFEEQAKQHKIPSNQIMSFYDSQMFKTYFERRGDVLYMNANNFTN